MAESSGSWASGAWRVSEGNEDEFVSRWKAWLGWSSENIPGFVSATLIRDAADPRHFLSFSAWEDAASRDAWKSSSGFAEKFSEVRGLCEEFLGGDYAVAANFSAGGTSA